MVEETENKVNLVIYRDSWWLVDNSAERRKSESEREKIELCRIDTRY